MIAHVAHEAALSTPEPDDERKPPPPAPTRRDYYISVSRRLPEPHPALSATRCPEELGYLLGWFAELSAVRTSSGFGANPISYAEIDAWARLTARDVSPAEIAILRKLDAALLAATRDPESVLNPPDDHG